MVARTSHTDISIFAGREPVVALVPCKADKTSTASPLPELVDSWLSGWLFSDAGFLLAAYLEWRFRERIVQTDYAASPLLPFSLHEEGDSIEGLVETGQVCLVVANNLLMEIRVVSKPSFASTSSGLS